MEDVSLWIAKTEIRQALPKSFVERDEAFRVLGFRWCNIAPVVAPHDDESSALRVQIALRAKRVWPNPEAAINPSIPPSVRISLNEAMGCLSGGHYTASVVMSGRALEAVARHFHVAGKADRLMLANGLEELRNEGKIDERLYQWGEELHEHRNLAAHATNKVFNQQDAEDLFEFANAICEYLFVLQDRFDRFMQRKVANQKAATV